MVQAQDPKYSPTDIDIVVEIAATMFPQNLDVDPEAITDTTAAAEKPRRSTPKKDRWNSRILSHLPCQRRGWPWVAGRLRDPLVPMSSSEMIRCFRAAVSGNAWYYVVLKCIS